MITISHFTAALILELTLALIAITVYLIYRVKGTRQQIQILKSKLAAAKADLISHNNTGGDQKQFIIDALLEKLDCFDQNNGDLESFNDSFKTLRQAYQELINHQESVKDEPSNDALELQLTEMENELQRILSNATTIIGQINREKISGKSSYH